MNMFKPVKAKSIKEYIDSIEEPRRAQIIEIDAIIQKTVPELKPLGKVSVGKSCIRFKKIEDVNLETLKEVLRTAEKDPGFE